MIVSFFVQHMLRINAFWEKSARRAGTRMAASTLLACQLESIGDGLLLLKEVNPLEGMVNV